MANRSRTPVVDPPVTDVPTPSAPEVPAVSETLTDPAVETTGDVSGETETTVQTGEAGESGEAVAAEAEEVIDLSAINAAVAAVLSGDDLTKPEELDYSGVITAYNALSRKGKATASRELATRSQSLLEAGNFDHARVVLMANKATKTAKAKGDDTPKEPADVTTPLVTKLVACQLAYATLTENLPEGVAEDWQARVTAAFETAKPEVDALRTYQSADAETRGDAPSVSDAAALAAKIAFKAVRKPYGPRHDVGTHIAQVFAGAESGTFLTDVQIAAAPSEEYAADDAQCSTSAVTARLKAVSEKNKPLADGLSVETRGDEYGVVKA